MAGEFSADVHDDYVIYMYPVSENGKEVSIIAGKKSKAQMEQLLSVGLFDDQGSFTIVDRNGDIVFRPDRKDFLHLINETDYDDSADWAVQIINDFRDGRQGSVSLPTTSGQTILLDYRPLSHFGWQTVNMVPENFISSEVDVFVNRMFIIILVLTTVFLALLLIIILMQARYSTKLEAAAFIDRITDGPSIIRFQMLARRMVSQAAPCSRAVAVLNIRRFKFINDLYGSKYGNRMLRDIYWAILEQTDPDDELVARGESDHYYMLLQYSSEDQLAERLSSLSDFLRKRFCGELDILLHFNIGVYLVDPADQPDIISFQDRANLARASADNSFSDSCIFYNEDFSFREKKELQLFQVITEALQNREFLMVLQPKIDLRDDSICGAEALARWNRPGEGMLSPAAFIPVMEKNGILPELDLCIFEQVCAVIRRWLDEGKTPVPISVNLSRQQLRARHFLRRYLEILHRHAVPADLIEFEITESTMFTDAEISEVKGLIEEIHNCGFRCSLDDFGSEYSALGLISEFPIDRIKLDRSFFSYDVRNPRAQAVIKSIISLAKKLSIDTVAEGVEHKAQVDMLKSIGCTMVQGYFFFPPLSVAQFEEAAFNRP